MGRIGNLIVRALYGPLGGGSKLPEVKVVTDLSTLTPGDVVFVNTTGIRAFADRVESNDGQWIASNDRVYTLTYAQSLIDRRLATVILVGRTDAALSLARGLADAANGDVVDLGDFRGYADDEPDAISDGMASVAGLQPGGHVTVNRHGYDVVMEIESNDGAFVTTTEGDRYMIALVDKDIAAGLVTIKLVAP